MTGNPPGRRGALWVLALVCGVTAVGLVLLSVLGGLDAGGQVAGLIGALTGVVGCALALWPLLGGGSGRDRDGRRSRVRAGRGGLAVGGSVVGTAVGARSRVTGPASGRPPASTTRSGSDADVAAGDDGLAVRGDVVDSALGEDSER
ncbi:hypothetical protein ACIQNU_16875 [Streptomyces sp. NPDC091292]|uniref:hypothetical protein n=1 Tax=Streptomyces sp. NPDC091292 TaxID=3365991 RepID=UPI00380C2627